MPDWPLWRFSRQMADWLQHPDPQVVTQSDIKMPFKVKLVQLYTWEKYDTQNSEFALGQVGQIEDREDCVFFGIWQDCCGTLPTRFWTRGCGAVGSFQVVGAWMLQKAPLATGGLEDTLLGKIGINIGIFVLGFGLGLESHYKNYSGHISWKLVLPWFSWGCNP